MGWIGTGFRAGFLSFPDLSARLKKEAGCASVAGLIGLFSPVARLSGARFGVQSARFLGYVFLMALLVSLPLSLARANDVETGRQVFDSVCTTCHGLDKARVGPPLRGVFGRRVGSVQGFHYSKALKEADFQWDEAGLERWLYDPESLIPGQEMDVRIPDASQRQGVIAFLKSLQ